MEKFELQPEVKSILDKLKQKDYEAYAVGGCVRDLLRGKKPKDWDITTNAKPKDIEKLFPNSFYNNKFGTVTVQTKSQEKSLKDIEVTTYRIEKSYTDKRHPDNVKFTSKLTNDLARRDFISSIILSVVIRYFHNECLTAIFEL